MKMFEWSIYSLKVEVEVKFTKVHCKSLLTIHNLLFKKCPNIFYTRFITDAINRIQFLIEKIQTKQITTFEALLFP